MPLLVLYASLSSLIFSLRFRDHHQKVHDDDLHPVFSTTSRWLLVCEDSIIFLLLNSLTFFLQVHYLTSREYLIVRRRNFYSSSFWRIDDKEVADNWAQWRESERLSWCSGWLKSRKPEWTRCTAIIMTSLNQEKVILTLTAIPLSPSLCHFHCRILRLLSSWKGTSSLVKNMIHDWSLSLLSPHSSLRFYSSFCIVNSIHFFIFFVTIWINWSFCYISSLPSFWWWWWLTWSLSVILAMIRMTRLLTETGSVLFVMKINEISTHSRFTFGNTTRLITRIPVRSVARLWVLRVLLTDTCWSIQERDPSSAGSATWLSQRMETCIDTWGLMA